MFASNTTTKLSVNAMNISDERDQSVANEVEIILFIVFVSSKSFATVHNFLVRQPFVVKTAILFVVVGFRAYDEK